MANSIYLINKGVNQPIMFKGFKAQYITYLAIGLVALLLLFAIMHFFSVPSYLSVPGVLIAGLFWVRYIHLLSNRYGQFGLLKKLAISRMPNSLHIDSRRVFIRPNKS